MNNYYSISEVASIVHKSEQSVGRWLREGKLPYIQVSERRRLIKESDLQLFLDSRIVTAPKKRIATSTSNELSSIEHRSLTTSGEIKGKMDVKSLREEISRLCQ